MRVYGIRCRSQKLPLHGKKDTWHTLVKKVDGEIGGIDLFDKKTCYLVHFYSLFFFFFFVILKINHYLISRCGSTYLIINFQNRRDERKIIEYKKAFLFHKRVKRDVKMLKT
jgi:hypothetical protein